MLIAFQSKIRMQTEAQRSRERKELEDRVAVRRSLLQQKVRATVSCVCPLAPFSHPPSLFSPLDHQMDHERKQFQEERNERLRLLVERQTQEMQAYDEESARLGFNALAIAEASCESVSDDHSVSGSMLSLAHSNSATSFTHAAL